jgi:hypothetical protein
MTDIVVGIFMWVLPFRWEKLSRTLNNIQAKSLAHSKNICSQQKTPAKPGLEFWLVAVSEGRIAFAAEIAR